MKVILKYNVPEDEYDYRMAVDGHKYYSFIVDFYNFLRNKVKYEQLSEADRSVYEDVYEHFHNEIRENEINLWK
jgi:hypothetical protein